MCSDGVGCLLIVNPFGDTIPIDIDSVNVSLNRGTLVCLRFGLLGWVVLVISVRVPPFFFGWLNFI